MTNAGPPGGAESPRTGPDIEMGLPESGTQHATSTDFELPVDPPAGDPFRADAPDPLSGEPATPPAARPAAAPLYDEVAAETVNAEAVGVEKVDAGMEGSPDFAGRGDRGDAVYGDAGGSGAAGALDAIKAFAAEKPQIYLGAAVAVGFLLGRLLSSSDDDES